MAFMDAIAAVGGSCEKDVILTTSPRLSADAVKTLIKMTSEKFGVENIVHRTDDGMIGGFTLRCGGVFYDMSVATQLSCLRESLDAAFEEEER